VITDPYSLSGGRDRALARFVHVDGGKSREAEMRARQVLMLVVTCAGTAACSGGGNDGDRHPLAELEQGLECQPAAVGLSLRFRNGQATPLQLIGEAPRFLQEIDITERVTSASDDGIAPLLASSAFSALDWSGVAEVEQIWVPSLDGTFTRERYFRGARWMEESSQLQLVAVDAGGRAAGAPWVANAGRDDDFRRSDDGFVRRFVARQLALGCASVGDCSGATFVSEGLVQFRDALDPRREARRVHPTAVALRLTWSELPSASYEVPVTLVSREDAPFDYGFQVDLEAVGAPVNGEHYVPGESVTLRVTFRDGAGQRLHPEGELPSYGEFFIGQVESGLRYLDLQEQTRLYYALKHRESNLFAMLSGPTDKLKTPTTVVDPLLFFGPQVPFATTALDGFTAVGQTVPPAAIIFGGLADPSLWSLPVSDLLTFSIPADAEPGTYVAAVKARRDYAGEALNRGATLDLQIGSAPSSFTPKTACRNCHAEKRTGFDTILHGVGDRRACFGCHASLGVEFDNALDIRVHTIHDRSDRFDGNVAECSICHLTPPEGPARGILP
jgi:hypothetical protein